MLRVDGQSLALDGQRDVEGVLGLFPVGTSPVVNPDSQKGRGLWRPPQGWLRRTGRPGFAAVPQ